MAHSCCESTQEQSPANSNQTHDPQNCPHKILKESQATALKDGSSIHFTVQQLPPLLTLIQVIHFEPVAHIHQPTQLATIAQAPPLALTQKHCVYRI
ncbi:hypothetical protein QEH59_15775 [Coraliomargarita sp. SDUM461004]|uniref:HMA domain-containing protein n=1 Tax=Thalassobacterium sedimentorum TaxID=3041258 RepID=A0ABU1AQL6_9BACT|nr:hypothetical protein [Coraliomargarita sp. SDUM461004]MDQ8195893.1 hypothetical protein [Coraliomargarita sp. SDUM461004]